jgi:biopolymer transport protein ExbD
MRLTRPTRGMAPVIPTASMADIAFLLVIFFMVTTAYSLDRTPMELPETKQQEESRKGSAIISITEDETFRFSAGEDDTEVVHGLEGLGARSATSPPRTACTRSSSRRTAA